MCRDRERKKRIGQFIISAFVYSYHTRPTAIAKPHSLLARLGTPLQRAGFYGPEIIGRADPPDPPSHLRCNVCRAIGNALVPQVDRASRMPRAPETKILSIPTRAICGAIADGARTVRASTPRQPTGAQHAAARCMISAPRDGTRGRDTKRVLPENARRVLRRHPARVPRVRALAPRAHLGPISGTAALALGIARGEFL